MTSVEPKSSRDEQPPTTRFWRRQFQNAPTLRQTVFDIVFGVLAPMACAIVDPIVFRGSHALFGRFAIFSYLFMVVAIAALGIHLAARTRSVVLSGVLCAGFSFATCLGIILLPLAIATLPLGIGILGFTPLITGFVFLRNGVRSFKGARTSRSWIGAALATVAFGMTILIPSVADLQVGRMTREAITVVVSGRTEEVETAVRRLKLLHRVKSIDALAWRYAEVSEERNKKAIAEAYAAITGEDIEHRLGMLMD